MSDLVDMLVTVYSTHPIIQDAIKLINSLRQENVRLVSQVEKARKQAFIEAMDELDKMRTLAATDFKSPNCQGQRGMDRTDAFYDAYHAIRRLSDTSTMREGE